MLTLAIILLFIILSLMTIGAFVTAEEKGVQEGLFIFTGNLVLYLVFAWISITIYKNWH